MLAVLAFVALLFYAGLVSLFYPWLLFVYLPRVGLSDRKMSRACRGIQTCTIVAQLACATTSHDLC